jgi:hypothetical protein
MIHKHTQLFLLLTTTRDNQARARMIAEGGIHKEFIVDWVGREGLSPLTHEKYLSEFVNHFYKHVIKLVDRGVRKSTGTGTDLLTFRQNITKFFV